MVETVISVLGKTRFLLHDEKILQTQIEEKLSQAGISFEREYHLDNSSIPDFMVNDLAIEVKIKGNAKSIYKQIERYASFEKVGAVLLITNRSMGLPEEINGKPCYFLNLGRAWL